MITYHGLARQLPGGKAVWVHLYEVAGQLAAAAKPDQTKGTYESFLRVGRHSGNEWVYLWGCVRVWGGGGSSNEWTEVWRMCKRVCVFVCVCVSSLCVGVCVCPTTKSRLKPITQTPHHPNLPKAIPRPTPHTLPTHTLQGVTLNPHICTSLH